MYIDIVLCQKSEMAKPKLYQMPSFSGLEKGDLVTAENNEVLEVISCLSFDPQSDTYKFILKTAQAEEPLEKLKGLVKSITYYEENKE